MWLCRCSQVELHQLPAAPVPSEVMQPSHIAATDTALVRLLTDGTG